MAPGPLARTGRHPAYLVLPLPEASSASSVHAYPEIPAAVHSALYLPVHSCDAGTNLSLMTVEFIFAVVTHSGVSSTEGTLTCAVVSIVVRLTRLEGGVTLARMNSASVAAACASR